MELREAIERRRLVTLSLVGGAALASGLAACQRGDQEGRQGGGGGPGAAESGEEVSALEDLMREHGVLRRILIVYDEAASRLATDRSDLDASALTDAASLFRQFGEDYHERSLEEAFVFPRLQKAGGADAGIVETLLAQHARGREVTDYILAATGGGSIGRANRAPLASALRTMTRMYESHAAWEDTIVFPAWKEAVAAAELHELAERFEELEHQQFGDDGFDEAVRRVRGIEQRLGLEDLGAFTAPSPPRPA